MKAIGNLFAGMFDSHKRRTFAVEWDRQRNLAQSFGPSHVAEIDAIFGRQS